MSFTPRPSREDDKGSGRSCRASRAVTGHATLCVARYGAESTWMLFQLLRMHMCYMSIH